MIPLAQAALNTDGISAFCSCLSLLRGYVERYWESVHPVLDPDDDYDPTPRVNTLTALCDADTTLRMLRKAPLVSSRTLGRFGLLDLEYATGGSPAPKGLEPPKMATIEAAFTDVELDQLQSDAAAVRQAIEDIRSLEMAVTAQVGVGKAASFQSLSDMLGCADKVLTEQLLRRGVGSEPAGEAAGDTGGEGGMENGGNGQRRLTGEVTSREEVILALDKICTYYERYEPSSPLPLLLKRAKRLATKSFLEIIRDLTPEALAQAQAIGGIAEEGGDS